MTDEWRQCVQESERWVGLLWVKRVFVVCLSVSLPSFNEEQPKRLHRKQKQPKRA